METIFRAAVIRSSAMPLSHVTRRSRSLCRIICDVCALLLLLLLLLLVDDSDQPRGVMTRRQMTRSPVLASRASRAARVGADKVDGNLAVVHVRKILLRSRRNVHGHTEGWCGGEEGERETKDCSRRVVRHLKMNSSSRDEMDALNALTARVDIHMPVGDCLARNVSRNTYNTSFARFERKALWLAVDRVTLWCHIYV